MFQILFIALIAVPILEIYLFFQVGGMIGVGWTILIVIATAVLGANLLRQQGLSTWARLNQSMAQGQLPPTVLVEGILLLISGAFLLTPGFFTDAVGFLVLMPAVRKLLAAYLLRQGLFIATSMHTSYSSQTRSETPSPSQQDVIEGEYERKDD